MPSFYNYQENQKGYHKTYKRKKRKSYERKLKEKDFCCFDGETENDKYTLLGNSQNYIYNKDGLSTWDCINFLWNEGKGKIKIIFAIHFDIQFWIRDLTDDKILDLLDGVEIEYYCYRLKYFSKKFLMITKGYGTIYVYDILPFFQKSFLSTVEKMKLNLSQKEKRILEEGKKSRGKNFKNMTKKQIILYNKTECIICEKVANKLRIILKNAELDFNGYKFNLYPSKLYGSGAIANKILKLLQFEKYAQDELKLSNKKLEMIKYSYYGGRFEVSKVGTFKNLYKYDINSAYPYAMQFLKEPKKFVISTYKKTSLTHFNFVDENIYLLEFDYTLADKNLLGILPIRRKDGYVIFPKKGKGYYFGLEAKYLNMLCKKTVGHFFVTKELKVSFHEKNVFPQGFIEKIYNERLSLKEQNDISEIAYKLGINSLYGKLAQQTGKRTYSNIYFASFITAYCRSMILEVMYKNDVIKNVVQISTDGIFLTKKLKDINVGKKLGQWDFEKYNKACVLGSGLYSLTKNKKTIYALRGIEVTKENFMKIYDKLKKSGNAKIFYNSFIGHKYALINHKKYGEYRLKFTKISKTVNIFEYQKRLFYNRKPITSITNSYWINIFLPGESIMTYKLKKFDELILLEDECISLITK